MVRQAIKQAEHIDCPEADSIEEDDEYFTLTDKTFKQDEHSTILYEVKCECGHETEVRVSTEGTDADDSITYENASWNQQ